MSLSYPISIQLYIIYYLYPILTIKRALISFSILLAGFFVEYMHVYVGIGFCDIRGKQIWSETYTELSE